MIPQVQDDLRQAFLVNVKLPDKTYRLDKERGRITSKVDGLEAVKQAIYLMINTERYRYPIYSWNYGIELAELIGKSPSYAIPEVQRRIKEALMQDDRITDVDAFSFTQNKQKVHLSFNVSTVYGEVKAEKEVQI